jgi:hypothetical protein
MQSPFSMPAGLPYAAWHTAAAPGAVAQGAVPTAPGAAAETHDDEHALLTPALDAIVLTKGPGAYVSAEVQVRPCITSSCQLNESG